MKIILLGYMASGKSTIGKGLAKKLNMNFIDLDNYISDKENMSISTIFDKKGEIYFRQVESKYLKEIISSQESLVLSLGGGTPCYADNMKYIKESNIFSVYIKASINTLVERLVNEKSQRPLIASLPNDKITEFVAKHLFERRFYYEQAHYSVIADNKSIKEIVSNILNLLD